MTTLGRTWRKGLYVPIAPYGVVRLADLPDLIGDLEAATGDPLVVVLPPDLPAAHQRLMATLGVDVRFDETAAMRIRRPPERA